jgi:polysaccharide deacetylase family protein (PEP-CTERM system associated)
MNATNHILLTIDVEDWFQVENFKQSIPFCCWPSCELRVEKNTHRLLNLLDSHSSQRSAVSGQLAIDNAPETNEGPVRRRRIVLDHFQPESDPDKKKSNKSGLPRRYEISYWGKSCQTTPKATFFVLGWIAERLPHLVREIHSRGHEVASHGYSHNLCIECSHEDLKRDLSDSKKLLEDIIGDRVYGYRAPSFSIDNDILKIIEECGYFYDSSFNSFGLNGQYGGIDLSRNGKNGIALQIPSTNRQSSIVNRQSSIFYELPISNIRLGNRILPWGGGRYFRLAPFPVFKIGVEFILRQENAYLFYLHPWEIDPDQPRFNDTSDFYEIRHYVNLSETHSKLSRLIESLAHCNFITCSQYLQQINEKCQSPKSQNNM